MTAIAYAVMVVGAIIALIGIFLMVFPLAGIPVAAFGGFIVWCGQLLRKKAREQAVNRQLGG